MAPLRVLVLVLSGLGTVGMLAILILILASGQLFSGEQMAREIAGIILLTYGAPYALFVLPAFVLGLLNRWLSLAFALCVLAVPVLIFVVSNA